MAPMASRIPISRRRAIARASITAATLAQATTRSSVTAPRSAEAMVRKSLTSVPRNGIANGDTTFPLSRAAHIGSCARSKS